MLKRNVKAGTEGEQALGCDLENAFSCCLCSHNKNHGPALPHSCLRCGSDSGHACSMEILPRN